MSFQGKILSQKCYRNVLLSQPHRNKKKLCENWLQVFSDTLENFLDEQGDVFNVELFKLKSQHMSPKAYKQLYWIASAFECLPKQQRIRAAYALQDEIHIREKNFAENVQDAVNIIKTPQSIGQILKLFRHKLVKVFARYDGFESKEEIKAWFNLASRLGYGVDPYPEEQVSQLDERYAKVIKNYFYEEYTFFTIFFAIKHQLKLALQRYGYDGEQPYSPYQARKFCEYLKYILKTPTFEHYLKNNATGQAIDVNWPNVYHMVLMRLIDDGYLNARRRELQTLRVLFPSPQFPMKYPPYLKHIQALLSTQPLFHMLTVLYRLYDFIPKGVYPNLLTFLKATIPLQQFEEIFYQDGKTNFIEAMNQENDLIAIIFMKAWRATQDFSEQMFFETENSRSQSLMMKMMLDQRKYFLFMLKIFQSKKGFLEKLLDLQVSSKGNTQTNLLEFLTYKNYIFEMSELIKGAKSNQQAMAQLYRQLFTQGRFAPLALLIKQHFNESLMQMLDYAASSQSMFEQLLNTNLSYNFKDLSLMTISLKTGNISVVMALLTYAARYSPQWIVPTFLTIQDRKEANFLLSGCMRCKGVAQQLQFLRLLFSDELAIPPKILFDALNPSGGILHIFRQSPTRLAVLFQAVWEHNFEDILSDLFQQIGGKKCSEFKSKTLKKTLNKKYYAAERLCAQMDIYYQIERLKFFAKTCHIEGKKMASWHAHELHKKLSECWLEFCLSKQTKLDLNILYDRCCDLIDISNQPQSSLIKHRKYIEIMQSFLEDLRQLSHNPFESNIRLFGANTSTKENLRSSQSPEPDGASQIRPLSKLY